LAITETETVLKDGGINGGINSLLAFAKKPWQMDRRYYKKFEYLPESNRALDKETEK
jgi:hypothetical protein